MNSGMGFIIFIIIIVAIFRSMTKAVREVKKEVIMQKKSRQIEKTNDHYETEWEEERKSVKPLQQPKPAGSAYQSIDMKKMNPPKQAQSQQEEPERKGIELDSAEELRRAIIYSEIINRKY